MDLLMRSIGWTDVPAQLPFLLIAVSYGLTSMAWLRACAVAGLSAHIAISLAAGAGPADMAWTAVYILINAAQLGWLIRDRLTWRPTIVERQMLSDALAPLDDAQVARVYKAGEFRDLGVGSRLTAEDRPVEELYFLCTGRAVVEVKGQPVAQLGPRSFVGEVAYLTGTPATATVTVSEPCRVLAFDRRRFEQVCTNDHQVAALIHGLLGRDLARKMSLSNTRLSAAREL